jgi:hypothetical protein
MNELRELAVDVRRVEPADGAERVLACASKVELTDRWGVGYEIARLDLKVDGRET